MSRRQFDYPFVVETAGDCYIVAGSLMRKDEDGFQALDWDTDVSRGAEKVMAFAKVWGGFGGDGVSTDRLHHMWQ